MKHLILQPPHPDTAIVAIGDVHGRADLLAKLLGKIDRQLRGRPSQIVFLGDYVDRGPDTRGVIELLLNFREARPNTLFVRGNHEEALLDFLGVGAKADCWLGWGGEETLDSYGVIASEPYDPDRLQADFAAALPDDHFTFLFELPSVIEMGPMIFVHAGLHPDRPLEAQEDRDLLWIRDEFYERGEERFGDRLVIHGHNPVKKPENLPWRINVDTGAVWSGKMTAIILADGERRFVST